MKQSGVRTPLTVHNTKDDIRRLVEGMARHMPEVLAEEESSIEELAASFGIAVPDNARQESSGIGRAPSPALTTTEVGSPLTLEHETSIDALDAAEWDRLLGDRGSFTAQGLRMVESAFHGGMRPEDTWTWHYYVVRDAGGRAVLATFFTHALWKDDMLAPARVSRRVEEHREADPYFLTSYALAMGSLLTEGDHMYLDRSADWRGALTLVLEAVAREQERYDAPTLVLRDVPEPDPELELFLREQGFSKLPMLDSLVLEGDFSDDEALLGQLSHRARRHQRREVLGREQPFDLEVIEHGGRNPSDEEFAHLYELYRNVERRGLELNSFDLPADILQRLHASPDWELVLLTLKPEHGGTPGGPPVAFGASFVGREHYSPMIVGLDYEWVVSHGSYRQALLQMVRRARHHGSSRILLGMGATLEKQRFGAKVKPRCAYVQSTDHYNLEVLEQIAADASGLVR